MADEIVEVLSSDTKVDTKDDLNIHEVNSENSVNVYEETHDINKLVSTETVNNMVEDTNNNMVEETNFVKDNIVENKDSVNVGGSKNSEKKMENVKKVAPIPTKNKRPLKPKRKKRSNRGLKNIGK